MLSAACMHDEAAAFVHVEAMLWTDGPVRGHCGAVDRTCRLQDIRTKAGRKNPEGVVRHGLWKCHEQFTVGEGIIFEESHPPLHLWLRAIHLTASSEKGISSHQPHRALGITHESMWSLMHCIHECMHTRELAPMGGNGEVDETFIRKRPGVVKAENTPGSLTR